MQSKTQSSQVGVSARQYGTSGRPVKVIANTFSIKTLPTQTIYHYDGESARLNRLKAHQLMCPSHLTVGMYGFTRNLSLRCALSVAI